MSVTRGGPDRQTTDVAQTVTDIATKVFQVTLLTTIALLGWFLWGVFSGRFGDVAGLSRPERLAVTNTVQSLSLWLNISLVLMLLSSMVAFYEAEVMAYVYLGLAAFLAFGLQYTADLLGVDKRSFNPDGISGKSLREIQLCAYLMGGAGALLFLRGMFARFMEARGGQDLANVSYGKEVKEQENVPRALIPAFAKCWQLPFCRETIRKNCPIFHARTKCWKQRTGCMCEENIIRLAMAVSEKNDAPPTVEMQKGQGFVALGDLIQKSEASEKEKITFRQGPNGVKIPTNPNLTETQKRFRCHNCIIYNEHQRQKYQLLAPFITLAVPLVMLWQYDAIRVLIAATMQKLDDIIGHLSLNPKEGAVAFASNLTSSVEIILVICLALVVMTWALRLLEYCVFKIKI